MANAPGDGLSRRERQIMESFMPRARRPRSKIVRSLPDPPSKTAVRTLLRILEEKGHLKHVEQGREYVYQPTQPRLRAGRWAFPARAADIFDGSLEKAVAAHIADSSADLSTEELKRLAKLIQQARNKGK